MALSRAASRAQDVGRPVAEAQRRHRTSTSSRWAPPSWIASSW